MVLSKKSKLKPKIKWNFNEDDDEEEDNFDSSEPKDRQVKVDTNSPTRTYQTTQTLGLI